MRSLRRVTAAAAILAAGSIAIRARTPPGSAAELAGLWQAKRRFGPQVRGTLRLEKREGVWRAEIAGRSINARSMGETIAFELPADQGTFEGALEPKSSRILGHWIQPPMVVNGSRYATPVTLEKRGDVWDGEVVPLEDALTLYLFVRVRNDGTAGAFLRNPERNIGRFLDVDHLERDGDSVRLVGAATPGEKARVLAAGAYREGRLSVWIPSRGGTYDFSRVPTGQPSDFYPRGMPEAPYTYRPPSAGEDGWPIGTLEDAGISREAIEKFVRKLVAAPIDSVHAPEVHGVLLARHGKLVFEEYFHGEHRQKPHDTRSASKSLTSTLAGAAIEAGLPVSLSTPVYQAMNGGAFPPGLEDRKRSITLEHLLTMSSGLDCDDSNDTSRGNEDVMQEQTAEPDWYRYTLSLASVRYPGGKAVYGSASPNLAGGVLARSTGRSLPVLIRDLLAGPLEMGRYHLFLTPTGDVYMGGGLQFLPRDFLKLGQLVLDGGTWKGRRVVSAEWCRRATSPLYELGRAKYGFLWWITDYPYRGRSVRAFYAAGNGGQIVMGVPDLDLVIAFYCGNYSDAAARLAQSVWVPEEILPAVADARR
jgi:CubicO group peptidase (beta-lactamase class C family)